MVAMNVAWASAYSVFKRLEGTLPPGPLVTLRFGLAAAVLGLVWPLLPGRAPRGWALWRCAVMGVVVFCVAPHLQVTGVQLGRAGDGAVLVALEPLVTSIGAALFLSERISSQRWAGFALGLVGVTFISEVWHPGFRLPGLVANVLILLSFVCETAYSVMGKPLIEGHGLVKVLGSALAFGTAANLLLDGSSTWAALPGLSGRTWALLAYLATILTLLGYALWYLAIRDADVHVVALTIYVQPVAGVLIATQWLGERLHWGQLWGSLAIVAGLVLALRNTEPPRNPGTTAMAANTRS
jgi:drug/metabolite transporter (DMT)-like permease